jgi:endonuclease IV
MGEGYLGEKGCAVFLSEPRFEKLPSVLETGRDNGAPA